MKENIYNVFKEVGKERKEFTLNTFLLLALWLVLGLAQWLVVALVKDVGWIFLKQYYINMLIFLLAIVLFTALLLINDLRFHKVGAPVLTVIIVELQIIALFTLAAYSLWYEMLLTFVTCVLLLFVTAGIGIYLPEKVDLTANIARISMISYFCLLFAVFFLMFHMQTKFHTHTSDFSFLTVEIPITLSILLFVMFHAQTISGGRFAEMGVHDYFLASLIFFHEFLIIFWMTFFWKIERVKSSFWQVSTATTPKPTEAAEF